MGVPLSQIKQVLAREEVTPGTAITNLSTADVKYDVIAPEFTPDVELIEQELALPEFTRAAPRPGLRTARFRSQMFCGGLAGAADLSSANVPPFDLFLRGCGWKRVALKSVIFTGFGSGNIFKNGQIFTANTTAATGRVRGTIVLGEGATLMTYEPLTGAVDATDTTLTIDAVNPLYDASLTVSSQTPANAGFAYVPVSKPATLITLTGAPSGGDSTFLAGELVKGVTSGALGVVLEDAASTTLKVRPVYREFLVDEVVNSQTDADTATIESTGNGGIAQLHYPTSTIELVEDGVANTLFGARGTAELSMPTGKPCRWSFDMQGIWAAGTDREPITGILTSQAVAPRFVSATIQERKGVGTGNVTTWIPVSSEITLRGAARNVNRLNPEGSEGADYSLGTGREPEISLNAEAVRLAVRANFNDVRSLAAGVRLRIRWGTQGTCNAFEIRCDQAVPVGVRHADRDGILEQQMTFSLRGDGTDDEAVFLVN